MIIVSEISISGVVNVLHSVWIQVRVGVGCFFFSFSLQGPKMCIPLAEEFFCSDKLTMSVSHNATVWHIL